MSISVIFAYWQYSICFRQIQVCPFLLISRIATISFLLSCPALSVPEVLLFVEPLRRATAVLGQEASAASQSVYPLLPVPLLTR